MNNPLKILVAWLNDAYAMEHSLTQVLEHHAKDASDQPELRARTEQHLAETRRHAELVAECLDLIDEKPSALKGTLGTAMGKMQGVSTALADDELIKNLLADYSAEHLEIASYTSLVAAAQQFGQERIATICTAILREEEAQAAWLREQLPFYTQRYLQRAAA